MENNNLENQEVEQTKEYSEPELPPPSLPRENELTYVMLAHIAAPIIWPWKRKQFSSVDVHGRAALNHFISCIGLFVVATIVLWVLSKIGFPQRLSIIIRLVIFVGSIGYSIFGLIKAEAGLLIQYPFPFQWVERIFNLPAVQPDEQSPNSGTDAESLDD